jgi:hypothetical protein
VLEVVRIGVFEVVEDWRESRIGLVFGRERWKMPALEEV